MKKFITLICLCLASQFLFATVHVVDNTGTVEGVFSTVRQAYDVAADGDTIYLQPSNTAYAVNFLGFSGTPSYSKSVSIIGPGHRPEYTNGLNAKINGSIYMNTGASNMIIAGLEWEWLNIQTVTSSNPLNIQILNNFIHACTAITLNYGGDWLIEGNVFFPVNSGCGGGNYINLRPDFGPTQNIVIKNNFFQTLNENNDRTSLVEGGSNTTQFINNTVLYLQLGVPFFNSSDMLIENNIFWTTRINNSNQEFTVTDCVGCTYNNNLFFNINEAYADNFGTDNIYDVGPQFEDVVVTNPDWDYDNNYQLSATSPALNAGTDGTDLGMFGANFNFSMFGFTSLPRFVSMETDRNVVRQGEDIIFSIEAISPGN